MKSGLVARTRAGIARLFKAQKILASVNDNRGWFSLNNDWGGMGAWQQDLQIDRSKVDSNWAVFSVRTLIAGDIGKVNLRLMEKKQGIWVEADWSNAFSPVLYKPNNFQTRQQFIECWTLSKLVQGNTYVLKERDARNVVIREYVLDPCRVTPLVSESGEVFYQLLDDHLSGLRETLPAVPASEIIHDRFNCLFHPLVGLSPIYASGLSAMLGKNIQENAAKFFKNMSRPSGILTAPGAISDETAKRLKESWDSNYTGEKIGKVAVLGDDLKYQAMTITAVDSQMLEQLKFSAEMICSTHHVPAFKIGAGTIPAGQKVEDLNQIYYSDCLHALMDAIQTLQTQGLGLDQLKDRELSVGFDLDDLLKMDTASFIGSIKTAIDASVMSPNEGRRKLNLPPVKGGEKPLSQQQNWTLEQLSERTPPADLPAKPAATTVVDASTDKDGAANIEAREFYEALMKGLESIDA